MPNPDAGTARALEALVRIEANQQHFTKTIEEIRRDQRRIAETAERHRAETDRGFGDVKSSVSVAFERLDSHIETDDRRFSELTVDVSSAHSRIGKLRREESPSSARLWQVVTAIGLGVAALLVAFANK